jgi:hypothetical protein
LIFDEHYNRKPAYFALRNAIATLSIGGTVGGNVRLLRTDDEERDEPWGSQWMPKQDNIQSDSMLSNDASHISGDCRPDWEQQN